MIPRDRVAARLVAFWLLVIAVLAALGACSAVAASLGQIREFSRGLNARSLLGDIALGPDGDMWFTDAGCLPVLDGSPYAAPCAIGRITPSGQITEFTVGLRAGGIPSDIALGPDGNMWFTDRGCIASNPTGPCAIGRITPSGQITEFITLKAGSIPGGIALAPDGNMWFTDQGCIAATGTCAIGRITPSGQITEFTTGLKAGSIPGGIVPGGDGNLWFTDSGCVSDVNPGVGACAIGRITPSGQITEFTTGLIARSVPSDIAPGPDGNLWFTDEGCSLGDFVPGHGRATHCAIGRITPSGQITEFSAGLTAGSIPSGLALGPDGNLWFADFRCDFGEEPCAIGRITPSGRITEFSAGLKAGSIPGDIALGRDGNLWFTAGSAIGRIGAGGGTPPSVAARVAILTSAARVSSNGALSVKLRCGAGSGRCAGTLALSVRVRVRRRHSRRTRLETIRTASARLALRAGHSTSVRLVLTQTGRRLLAAARHHRLVTAAAAVTKTNTARRHITLTEASSDRRQR